MTRSISRTLALFLLLISLACSGPKVPEFVALENVKLRGARFDGQMRLRADAVLHNPNPVELEIIGVDLELTLDGEPAAEIREIESSVLPADAETAVPLRIEFPFTAVYEDLGDLLSDLGSERTFELELTGKFRVKALGVELDVPVRHTREYDLKL